MAITVTPQKDTGEGDGSNIELHYLIHGTDSDIEARAALADTAPEIYAGLYRKSCKVEPLDNPVQTLAWDGTATYGEKDRNDYEVGESSYSFDTGGGTQHITQSIKTEHSYAVSGDAIDFDKAIGVSRDGVAGVDVSVPVFNFTETHYFSPSTVTEAFKQKIFKATGKVNSDAFRGFAAGEVLFLGASGSRQGEGADDKWEITFRFAASENQNNITVGDITGIEKNGWDHLWVYYVEDEKEAGTKKYIVKTPTYAYVEKIYRTTAFSGLGI